MHLLYASKILNYFLSSQPSTLGFSSWSIFKQLDSVPSAVWRYVCVHLTMHSFCPCLSSVVCFCGHNERPFVRQSVYLLLPPLLLVSLALLCSAFLYYSPNCCSSTTSAHTWSCSLCSSFWFCFALSFLFCLPFLSFFLLFQRSHTTKQQQKNASDGFCQK